MNIVNSLLQCLNTCLIWSACALHYLSFCEGYQILDDDPTAALLTIFCDLLPFQALLFYFLCLLEIYKRRRCLYLAYMSSQIQNTTSPSLRYEARGATLLDAVDGAHVQQRFVLDSDVTCILWIKRWSDHRLQEYWQLCCLASRLRES